MALNLDAADEVVDALDDYLNARVRADRANGGDGTGRARLEARATLVDVLRILIAEAVR